MYHFLPIRFSLPAIFSQFTYFDKINCLGLILRTSLYLNLGIMCPVLGKGYSSLILTSLTRQILISQPLREWVLVEEPLSDVPLTCFFIVCNKFIHIFFG